MNIDVKLLLYLPKRTGIIVGAMAFKMNVYDGHTLKRLKTATVDRDYKGKQIVGTTQINIPKPPLKRDNDYQKRKKRKHFRRRAARAYY